MKKLGILLVATTLALSACGKRDESTALTVTGYDGEGNVIGGDSPALGAAILGEFKIRVDSIPASLTTVRAGGTGSSDPAVIRAVITDTNNVPVSDAEVSFASTGGTFSNPVLVTDANGVATIDLLVDGDPANQDIMVTVASGNYTGVARVFVSGTVMEATGEDNVVAGSDVEIMATLTAGTGEPLANQIVEITSAAGNTLSTTSAVTDAHGQISLMAGTANGSDTISFSAVKTQDGVATVFADYEFSVSDDQLQFVPNTKTQLPVGGSHAMSVNWTIGGSPIVGEDVKFTITSGQVLGSSTVTTGANGNATVNVSSNIAGEVVLYVEAADGSVVNKHTFNFVGVTPDDINVKTSSSRVITRDRATISVEVIDANGNAVSNKPVVFSSDNLKGGQISATSATTDVDGIAEITFTAGATATEADEVAIRAQVEGTTVFDTVLLTVAEPALNVILGTANSIEYEGTSARLSVQFKNPYVVQVADGSGQPLAGAEVHLSIEPVAYRKGEVTAVDTLGMLPFEISAPDVFAAKYWRVLDEVYYGDFNNDGVNETFSYTVTCDNEDANGNRVLDAGEDTNGNGMLDPQDPANIAAHPTSVPTVDANGILTTDDAGFGYFDLVYPSNYALWAKVRIIARAQALGVEAESVYETILLQSGDVASDINVAPNNQTSPYGKVLDCTSTQ